MILPAATSNEAAAPAIGSDPTDRPYRFHAAPRPSRSPEAPGETVVRRDAPPAGAAGGSSARRRWARLLRPHARWLAAVVGLLALLAIVDLAQPYFLRLLVDEVFTGTPGRWSLLWLVLPGMGLIYVTRNTLFFASRMRALRISEDICFDLRKRLFEHLQQLSLRFHRAQQPGRLGARLMDDTFRIQTVIQERLPNFIRFLLEIQVLLAVIYVVNWRLAIAATIVLPLHVLTFRRFRAPIRRSHAEAQERLAVAHGTIVERFLGMEVVKGFSAEKRESDAFTEAIAASRTSQIRSQRFHFAQKVVADLLVGLGTVLLLGYGAFEVHAGRMSGGAFVMFFWYVRMLYPAILEVITDAGHLSRASASVDRVFDMLDRPPAEPGVQRSAIPAGTGATGIAFRGVSFRYEPTGPCALDGIDLAIEPGEHVAITGPSGCGKSTLLSLLPRFNAPTTGTIEIGRRPANEIPLPELRALFGFVFQDVFLFDTTIEENIRYARPEASRDEVEAACRITGIHDAIARLPDGYYTRLGGAAGELSRGERQRITLARALIRDARILVLDEATASIDPNAAKEIIASILERMKGRTVIMVTHDPDLLELVDRVIRLDGGRVVDDAPPASAHSALLEEMTRRRSALRLSGSSVALLALSAIVAGAAGCVRDAGRTRVGLQMDEPKVTAGVVMESPDERVDFRRLAAAIDALEAGERPDTHSAWREGEPAEPWDTHSLSAAQHPADTGLADDDRIASRADGPPAPGFMTEPPEPWEPWDTHSVAAAQHPSDTGLANDDRIASHADGPPAPGFMTRVPEPLLPTDAVRVIPLPKMSATEIAELVDLLALRLAADEGYGDATSIMSDDLPAPPDGVVVDRILAKRTTGDPRILQIGHRRFASQPPQLWVVAVTMDASGMLAPSGEGERVEAAVIALVADARQLREDITVADLESKLVQLSYVDAAKALKLLKGLGITTVEQPEAMPATIDFASLPYALLVPDPDPADVGLLGGTMTSRGEFGVSLTPSLASQLPSNMIASPTTQLLVMFHPAHPEQFSRVRRLLDDLIDRPARQIFVEGMVLEISEDGLRDLGIEWELRGGPISLNFGSEHADGLDDTLEVRSDDLDFWRILDGEFDYDVSARIRALIRDGKAEVLSRPSVLTLDNRQSTIRVGQDIPIATSQEGTASESNKIAFTFSYLPTGILLNIRPRISEDGGEVSMLIDTIVSDVVPGEDLQIRSVDGELLASAPTVSTRRVQTYARIRNNTPFIIGGLVARLDTTVMDKVPLLGDMPFIGALFRAERSTTTKREVIIVLTPYVLTENGLANRAQPKDDDLFDNFGHELFRDSYRIRAEDVFDLHFLLENERLAAYRAAAAEAIAANFRLADEEPFHSFAKGAIPGEGALVTRMIYDVGKRLGAGERIPLEKVIFFAGLEADGYVVQFLENALARLGGGSDPDRFFDRQQGKALAITFRSGGTTWSDPVPELALHDCPDRTAWGDLLWKLNQPDEAGRLRASILIHDESDLLRLRRAIAIKHIVDLNGGEKQLRLSTLGAGKVLFMPDFKPEQIHLVDPEVAHIFYFTEHYYAAALQAIEERLLELDEALRRPDLRALRAE